jgi:hypothetical protein
MFTKASMDGKAKQEFGVLNLPHEIIDKILSFLTYDEVSSCRAVRIFMPIFI